MHSLKELYDHLISKEIKIREFNGWQLKVCEDTWTLAFDVFYKNGQAQNLKKEKTIFDDYKRIQENEQLPPKTVKKIMSARFS